MFELDLLEDLDDVDAGDELIVHAASRSRRSAGAAPGAGHDRAAPAPAGPELVDVAWFASSHPG